MLSTPVLELLHAQHGLIADRQLVDVVPDRNRRRAVHRDPDMERLDHRVWRHRAVPPTADQALMHAVLSAGPDAVLWGKTAASHWGFGRFRKVPPHVAIERRHRHDSAMIGHVHQVRYLDDTCRTTHQDLPIARPEETVLWLAGMWTHALGHERAALVFDRTLDHAWRQDLIDGVAIHDLADRSGGKGRSGIVVLRAALATRPPDYQPAGSGLEERFEEIVPWTVQNVLQRQVHIDAGRKIQVVDFELESWPLIVEINGEPWHTSITDRANDDARYARLMAAGYSVVVFWHYDVWHDAPTVRAAMSRLRESPDRIPTLHRPTRAPWEC